ncbi:N/A [soil metagenome]
MKKCVLICDDDVDILEVCSTILHLHNYDTITSPNCENVFELLKTHTPDLILMDLWVPEMGGEKATEKLKTDPETSHLPVILFSANREIENVAQKVNANDFICKPFDIQEFIIKINKNML